MSIKSLILHFILLSQLFFIFLSAEETLNAPPPSKKGKKRAKADGKDSGDFKVEYAKSSRSTCKGCDEKIMKGEMRISKKDYESKEAMRYGGLDRWHHVECFVKLRADLEYYENGAELLGIKELSKEDQETIKSVLPKMSAGKKNIYVCARAYIYTKDNKSDKFLD